MGAVGLNFGSATSGAGFDVTSTVNQIVTNLQTVEGPWKAQITKLANQDTQLIGVKAALEAAARGNKTRGEKDIYAPLVGSDEERRGAISEAIQAWGDTAYPKDPNSNGWGPWISIAATFEDLIAKVSEAGGEMVHVVEEERP